METRIKKIRPIFHTSSIYYGECGNCGEFVPLGYYCNKCGFKFINADKEKINKEKELFGH